MGFRLTPIFIKSEDAKSDEEILKMVGLSYLEKGEAINFYATSKKYERVFLGGKGNCKILCNGELAYKAFEDENPFLKFEKTEIVSIIWNETAFIFGFSLIKNAKIIRKLMIADEKLQYDFGDPISEEFDIKDEEIYSSEEMENMIKNEGEEAFKEMVKIEKIVRVTNILAERYIGVGLLQIQERIELNEYE